LPGTVWNGHAYVLARLSRVLVWFCCILFSVGWRSEWHSVHECFVRDNDPKLWSAWKSLWRQKPNVRVHECVSIRVRTIVWKSDSR